MKIQRSIMDNFNPHLSKTALAGRDWAQGLRTLVAISLTTLLLTACMGGSQDVKQVDDGQCWSQKGGVGNLIRNSSTKAECKTAGGKSWCAVGGGCVDI